MILDPLLEQIEIDHIGFHAQKAISRSVKENVFFQKVSAVTVNQSQGNLAGFTPPISVVDRPILNFYGMILHKN